MIQLNYPFEIVSLDICGAYNRTPWGVRFVLTFVDYFTRYAEAIPLTEITAEAFARAFATHVIARHGSGSLLATAQGRQFTSAFFKETCKIFGVRQMNTSARHPMSNGMVERLNKTMKQGLSHYVNAAGTNCAVLLPLYLMAYRATPHGSTRCSPFFLLHGREMILPTSQKLRAKLAPDI